MAVFAFLACALEFAGDDLEDNNACVEAVRKNKYGAVNGVLKVADH